MHYSITIKGNPINRNLFDKMEIDSSIETHSLLQCNYLSNHLTIKLLLIILVLHILFQTVTFEKGYYTLSQIIAKINSMDSIQLNISIVHEHFG